MLAMLLRLGSSKMVWAIRVGRKGGKGRGLG